MDLLEAWAEWSPESPPYLLNADRDLLIGPQSGNEVVVYPGWEQFIQDPNFGAPGDRRLHLGLLPQPFLGDMRNASIYLLLLNPGLAPMDYFGEHMVPGYYQAILNNIRQLTGSEKPTFLFLEPSFAWHSGFTWWNRKLRKLIHAMAVARNVHFAEARKRLSNELAAIEFFPYHSAEFSVSHRVLERLPSVMLARTFVHKYALPRVQQKKALLIVLRKGSAWDLPSDPGIVIYKGAESRGAHLTPNSRGGMAILRHLDMTLG